MSHYRTSFPIAFLFFFLWTKKMKEEGKMDTKIPYQYEGIELQEVEYNLLLEAGYVLYDLT